VRIDFDLVEERFDFVVIVIVARRKIGHALGYEGGFVAEADGAFVWGFWDTGEGDVV